jgi:hypothetical protein
MKKIAFVLAVLIVLVVMISANVERHPSSSTAVAVPKKPCYGYTIIEFGKGIDCDGDTVKLVKVNGGQQLMMHEEMNSQLTAKN